MILKTDFLMRFRRNYARPLFLSALLLSSAIGARAQNSILIDEFRSVDMPSADVWSFMKYGNTPVSLYTGALKLSIPVYVYKNGDFEIPISIDYACDGFIPNMPSGSVGHGWLLNAGGVITRQVRGVPDEYKAGEYHPEVPFRQYISDRRSGYYSYYEQMCTTLDARAWYDKTKEECETVSFPFVAENVYVLGKGPNDRELFAETSPDIFSFKFPGHNGKFHMDLNKVKVYNTNGPQGVYHVDLSSFRPGTDQDKSKIVITTGDGYEYTFGGLDRVQDTKIETDYRYYYWYPECETMPDPRRSEDNTKEEYSSWMLTRIKAPNGQIATFNYSDLKVVESVRPDGNAKGALNFLACTKYVTRIRQLTSIDIAGKCRIVFDYTGNHTESGVKVGGEDSYEYMTESQSHYPDIGIGTIKVADKLRSVVVNSIRKDQTREIKRASLYYTSLGHKVSLSEVNISGEGSFSMDYYGRSATFPENGIASYDYWGYYNGRGKYHPHDLNINYSAEVTSIEPNFGIPARYPNFEGMKIGMLAQIVYPTGGCSYFEYEPNDASLVVYRSTNKNNGWPYLDNYRLYRVAEPGLNNLVGGVRIKKIVDSDKPFPPSCSPFDYSVSNTEAATISSTTREYFYTTTDGKSSGIVLNFPIYSTRYYRYYDDILGEDCRIFTPVNQCVQSLGEHHIQYRRVVEKFKNNSSTEYWFSTYYDTPDTWNGAGYQKPVLFGHNASDDFYVMDPEVYYNPSAPVIPIDTIAGNSPIFTRPSKLEYRYPWAGFQYINTFQQAVISHADRRGRLIAKKTYNSDNQPVTLEAYNYISDNTGHTSEALHTGGLRYEHRILSGACLQNGVLSVRYIPYGQEIKTIKEFVHNSLGQVVSTTDVASDGREVTTRTQYVDDILKNSTDPVCQSLKNARILGLPVKTQIYSKRKDGKTFLCDAAYYNYSLTGGVPLLSGVKKADIAIPYVCSSPGTITYSRSVASYLYDSRGNIIQVTTEAGESTAYIWSYDQSLLVAEIRNATYEQVESALGSGALYDITRNAMPSSNDFSMLNSLRSNTALGQAHITTFEHKPMVGVTKITDPSGRKRYFSYDEANKLKTIRDEDGNVVDEYRYGISHYLMPVEDLD